jgi:alkanesulfonate monooxygenase SsuD/methylene tetrahydromethanopterin reductase-like flavin-dependent oxidoreductase (luciferase family)
LGYLLTCEEFDPKELVRQAVRAQAAGFERLWISDHFHPWNDKQGQSPFVWSVIGAVSQLGQILATPADFEQASSLVPKSAA